MLTNFNKRYLSTVKELQRLNRNLHISAGTKITVEKPPSFLIWISSFNPWLPLCAGGHKATVRLNDLLEGLIGLEQLLYSWQSLSQQKHVDGNQDMGPVLERRGTSFQVTLPLELILSAVTCDNMCAEFQQWKPGFLLRSAMQVCSTCGTDSSYSDSSLLTW